MEFQSVCLIFLLGVMGQVEVANGLCLVRNTTDPNYYWYQCFMSNDYLLDLKRAPVDVKGISVVSTKIPVVRNGVFSRFNKILDSLGIVSCGVKEIEDDALRGLTELTYLSFAGNRLEVLKSAWLKGLPKLKVVSFQNNRIKHVDDDFFSILPRSLNTLDIPNNRLTCLPTASFGNFSINEFNLGNNRLTWECRVRITEWLKKADIWEDSENSDNMDPPYDLARLCVSRLPQARSSREVLNKCIEDMTHDLLPFHGDYTVSQVCQFHESKPSPFLNCTK